MLSSETLIHRAPAETCAVHGCGGGTWPTQAPSAPSAPQGAKGPLYHQAQPTASRRSGPLACSVRKARPPAGPRQSTCRARRATGAGGPSLKSAAPSVRGETGTIRPCSPRALGTVPQMGTHITRIQSSTSSARREHSRTWIEAGRHPDTPTPGDRIPDCTDAHRHPVAAAGGGNRSVTPAPGQKQRTAARSGGGGSRAAPQARPAPPPNPPRAPHLGPAEQLGDEADGLQVALGQEQLALLQPDLLLQLLLLLRLQLLQLLLAAAQLTVPLLLLPPAQLLLALPLPLQLLQLLLFPAGTRRPLP